MEQFLDCLFWLINPDGSYVLRELIKKFKYIVLKRKFFDTAGNVTQARLSRELYVSFAVKYTSNIYIYINIF